MGRRPDTGGRADAIAAVPRDVGATTPLKRLARIGAAMIVGIVAGSIDRGPHPVSAAVFTVTNTDASGPGSLAAAIRDADAGAGTDMIAVAAGVSGEIVLDGPLVVSDDGIVIDGPGSGSLTVSIATGDVFFASAAQLVISGLTLSGGTGGAAVHLTADSSVVLDDVVLVGAGDGISGDVASAISMSNSVASGLPGSGIHVESLGAGGLTVTSSELLDNRMGIWLAFSGPVAIADSVVSGNGPTAPTSSAPPAGGILVYSTVEPVRLDRTVVSGNSAYFSPALTVGADDDYGAAVTIVDSTIAGNASAQGVPLSIFGRDTSIVRSTISGNAGFGASAIEFGGDFRRLLIENSTIVENVAVGPDVFSIEGGEVDIVHSTIAGNAGTARSRPDDKVFLLAAPERIRISHSIISSTAPVVVAGAPGFDIDHSLLGTIDESQWSGAGNRFTDDPLLGPLGDHGGATATMVPLIGSFAIDGGDPAVVGAPDTDQRGAPRVRNVIDIGAVEVDAGRVELGPIAITVAETSGAVTLTVTRSAGTEGAASVVVSTIDGSAIAGADFTAVNQLVRWDEGEFGPKAVTIPILHDATHPEADESFTVTVSEPKGVALGAATSATVTITNVAPPPTLPPTGLRRASGVLVALAAALVALGALVGRLGSRPPT